ncbi:Y-family DNA polymerase [Vibrio alginolyticus]|nr:Y-family DNA polymerase [Vibrio alginolyticus]
MIALVDADAFYCNCETVFKPEWRGKPIAVLSNNDGCVVACNRMAKQAGVQKFKPLFEQPVVQSTGKRDSPGTIFLSCNYELYADLSAKMMDVIGQFCPDQLIYSVDECFLDFKNCMKAIPNLLDHITNIRRNVWKQCRLPVSIGAAETLTLSKVASRIAKSSPHFNGVCIIENEHDRRKYLKSLHVSEVWGIGRQLQVHLKHMGIDNALQLADSDPGRMRRAFNVEMERTIRELNGIKAKAWNHNEVSKKQIFSTRSLGERITQKIFLQQALAKHAAIASAKAREQKSLASVMLVFASTSAFDKTEHYSKRIIVRFEHPTADSDKVTAAATRAAKEIFKEGIRFYKIGVGLLELSSAKHEQQDLFNPQPNNPNLMNVLDSLNARYGRDTLFLGAQGIEPKWSMRRERLTARYTTRWSDLPRLRC